jgi:hypothetical protein
VAIKARWELSEDKQRATNLDLQKGERQLKRLRDSNEISASLHIFQDSDPQTVSDLLGLEPDNTSSKGTVRHLGRWEMRSGSSFWKLSSKDKVRQNTIEDHLKWLLNQISGKLVNLRRLQDSGAVTYVSLRIVSWSRTQQAEISVETSQLLASYRLPIRLIMHYENTDEEY